MTNTTNPYPTAPCWRWSRTPGGPWQQTLVTDVGGVLHVLPISTNCDFLTPLDKCVGWEWAHVLSPDEIERQKAEAVRVAVEAEQARVKGAVREIVAALRKVKLAPDGYPEMYDAVLLLLKLERTARDRPRGTTAGQLLAWSEQNKTPPEVIEALNAAVEA